jgi:hypothetical protein
MEWSKRGRSCDYFRISTRLHNFSNLALPADSFTLSTLVNPFQSRQYLTSDPTCSGGMFGAISKGFGSCLASFSI